ncbi:dynein axonemal heavy chain 10-like [Conger conger]|uniref:dynein axonemal heavy chain 10-like n=1 Tax=Conger conger TaxID=82655 RepID=UPI002A5A42D0|nr:dynein axonemal heavy chain 10-like [Conger conger]
MVFMDPRNLRDAPYWQKWVKTRGSKQPELDRLFEKYVPKCIDTIVDGVVDGKQEEKLKTIVPQTDLNMAYSCADTDAVVKDGDDDDEEYDSVTKLTATQIRVATGLLCRGFSDFSLLHRFQNEVYNILEGAVLRGPLHKFIKE